MDGSCLRMRNTRLDYDWEWYSSNDYIYTSIGNVSSSRNYIIKLLGKADTSIKTVGIRMYDTGTGAEIQQFFTVNNTSTNKEILYRNPATTVGALLRFVGCDGDTSIYFDNVWCYDATVNLLDVSSNFHLIYNSSLNIIKHYTLSASMNDLKGAIYNAGNVDISTWDSLTLLGSGTVTETTDGSGTTSIPYVTTTAVSNIFTTSASSGGNVTHDGSTSVFLKGVVWNTSIDPTILNSSTNNGTGEGSYTSAISGLNASTHYYVRAYATNAIGTGYGSNVQFDTSTIVVPALTLNYLKGNTNNFYTYNGTRLIYLK
jgi:hypothetical protein